MLADAAGSPARGRVLVVDDEETIVEFLRMGLTYEGWSVEAAMDGDAALELARRERPDLVILDVMLPGLDGLQVCQRLRGMGDVPIIMLTARGELEDRVAGLDIGADDYLVKPFRFQELLARIRAVLRRRAPLAGSVVQVADVRLDRDAREVERGGRPVELTGREFDLLELLMDHPRHVLSRETILNRLWGYDFYGDTNVIDVHIAALRRKLGDTDHALIRTVRGIGYTVRP
jgi:two-component system, OmpR family, response regulator MprA